MVKINTNLRNTLCVAAMLFGALVPSVALGYATTPPIDASYNNRIIDDQIFTNSNSMSVQDIQNFLNSKVPACDTNHAGGDPNQPPPYQCLRDYIDPTTGKKAAQLIYDEATAVGLNPQVILVTLQKEQSLVTDNWPYPSQYKSAMGYGCPESQSACDTLYYGFYNQVRLGARLLRAGEARNCGDTATLSNWSIGPQWAKGNSPAVDGVATRLDTCSTGALYNYTPHRPDSAYTLRSGSYYYGNYNFISFFSRWFGPTQLINSSIELSQGLNLSPPNNLFVNDNLVASYKIKNTSTLDINAGGFGVCARMNGQNYDFGFNDHLLISASSEVTVNYTKRLNAAGVLTLFTCSYNEGMGGWVSDRYPYDFTNSLSRQASVTVGDNPAITAGISLSPANPAAGQPVTATTTITNSSASPMSIGSIIISGRDTQGRNMDFPESANINVPANGTYTYTQTRSFPSEGTYSFSIVNWRGGGYDWTYPKSANASIVRQASANILPNPVLSAGIAFSPANPAIGQLVTATMTLRNASPQPMNIGSMVIAARSPSGNNEDFAINNDVIVPANGAFTYSQTRTLSSVGRYSLFVAHWDKVWDTTYPKSADANINRTASLTTLDNPLLTAGISLSTAAPTVGNPLTATLSIRNASSSPVTIGSIIISARDPLGRNVDFAEEATITIPASSTYTYSKTRTFALAGLYTLTVVNWRGAGYDRTYPKSVDASIIRQTVIQIN